MVIAIKDNQELTQNMARKIQTQINKKSNEMAKREAFSIKNSFEGVHTYEQS